MAKRPTTCGRSTGHSTCHMWQVYWTLNMPHVTCGRSTGHYIYGSVRWSKELQHVIIMPGINMEIAHIEDA